MNTKNIITTLASFLFAFSVCASPPTESEFEAVRIDGIDNSFLDPKESHGPYEEVTFTYDPSILSDVPKSQVSIEMLKELSRDMSQEEYKNKLQTQVQIPIAPESVDELVTLKDMPQKDIDSFITKKTQFLTEASRYLSAIKIKFASINRIIRLMNTQFFRSAPLVADANARVATIQLGIAGGVGFAEWIMSRLKESPYFKNLPDTAGFYFMLAAGFSIVKTTKNGKTRISIEPIVEFRKATRIFSPFLFAAAGLTGSYTWENRRESTVLQKATFYRISSLNALSGSQQFGFAASAAYAFPPGGGAVAGMEGHAYRLRITPEILIKFIDMVKTHTRKMRSPSCRKVLLTK